MKTTFRCGQSIYYLCITLYSKVAQWHIVIIKSLKMAMLSDLKSLLYNVHVLIWTIIMKSWPYLYYRCQISYLHNNICYVLHRSLRIHIFFYILWKTSRLKSTFLPYHVKKHHSTLEMDTFKGMLLLSYLASLDNKPRTCL